MLPLTTASNWTDLLAAAGDVALAPAAPLPPNPALDAQRHQQRLQGVLDALVAGLRFDGGLVYLLDDDTTCLRLTVSAGQCDLLPQAACRTLPAADADLAALAGNAVVLDEPTATAQWNLPADCGAAVCLPISSDTTVYGTLWLTARKLRRVPEREQGLIEIAAGRLAVELELQLLRSSVASEVAAAPSTPAVAAPSTSARIVTEITALSPPAGPVRSLLPSATPQLDELEVAGWLAELGAFEGFYDWQTLIDGRLLVASGATLRRNGEESALLSLQAARIALRSQASASHDAGELLTRVNHTLWTASPGSDGVSLAVCLLDGETAEGTLALAGQGLAVRWRGSRCERIDGNGPPLGQSERGIYIGRECSLVVRERLLLGVARMNRRPADLLAKWLHDLERQPLESQRTLPARSALRMARDAAHHLQLPLGSLTLVRRR